MTYLYKHIFLVLRKHAIPYSDKAVFFRRQQSESAQGPINDSDDIVNKVVSDYQAIIEEQERQNLLRVDALSESLRQAYSVLGSQIKELNKSNKHDSDFLETLAQGIRNLTSRIKSTKNSFQHPSTQRR
jgi:ribosome-binding protein aMBF1 (putative translation factor)